MNVIEWGAVISAGLSFAGWVISLEVRLRDVQAKLLISEQKNKDAAITNEVKTLSDSQLDADIASELGGGTSHHSP